jgi:hypothetical protein
MKVIFIAGKYRDDRGEYYVQENIRVAEYASLAVWQQGAVALCPHKNSGFLGGAEGTDDQLWLDGYIELLKRCDAVWAIPGWDESEGASNEVQTALALSIPVLYSLEEVKAFILETIEKKLDD